MVGDHLELDPVGEAAGARQAGHANGLRRRFGPRGIWKQEDVVGQDAGDVLRRRVEVDPPDGDRDHLGARSGDGVSHRSKVSYLPVPRISRERNARPAIVSSSPMALPSLA